MLRLVAPADVTGAHRGSLGLYWADHPDLSGSPMVTVFIVNLRSRDKAVLHSVTRIVTKNQPKGYFNH